MVLIPPQVLPMDVEDKHKSKMEVVFILPEINIYKQILMVPTQINTLM